MDGMNRLQELQHTERMFANYRKALDDADMEAELKKHDAPKITAAHRAQLDGLIEVLEEAKRYTYWYHDQLELHKDKEDARLYIGVRAQDDYQKHSRQWTSAQERIASLLGTYEYFHVRVPEGAGLPTMKSIKHRYKKPDKEVVKFLAAAKGIMTYNANWMKEWLERGGENFITNPRESKKFRN